MSTSIVVLRYYLNWGKNIRGKQAFAR